MAKERKTINVSLQSKKYLDSVNKILNEWEDDSLNLSTQICETLLLMDRLKKSATFANVIAMYELIEKMMKVYHIEDEAQLNAIFAEVVSVDSSKLTHLLSQLNQETKTQTNTVVIEKTKPFIQVDENNMKEEAITAEDVEVNPNTKQTKENDIVNTPNSQANNELAMTGEIEVPMDFLLNG